MLGFGAIHHHVSFDPSSMVRQCHFGVDRMSVPRQRQGALLPFAVSFNGRDLGWLPIFGALGTLKLQVDWFQVLNTWPVLFLVYTVMSSELQTSKCSLSSFRAGAVRTEIYHASPKTGTVAGSTDRRRLILTGVASITPSTALDNPWTTTDSDLCIPQSLATCIARVTSTNPAVSARV